MRVVGHYVFLYFFCQAEDGIRDLVRSRGLGDVYKRQEDRISDWLKIRLNSKQVQVNSNLIKNQTNNVK